MVHPLGKALMDQAKKEIIVTITCACFVAATAVISALIARTPNTSYEVRVVPSYENVATTDYFPLKVGNSWTYVGTARNAVQGREAEECKVRVQMRVIDAIAGPKAILFLMQGHPSDAAWALKQGDSARTELSLEPSHYGYLVVANKVFRVAQPALDGAIAAIRDGEVMPDTALSNCEMEFEFPLFRGQAYGQLSQLARRDMMYAWHVLDSTLYHCPEGERVRECPHYTLVYNTLPDHSQVDFVPYLGITSYSYSHHGTPAQVDVWLKGYAINGTH